MVNNNYRNPLWDALEYGLLRPLGSKFYSTLNELPDAPWMHSAASNYIFNDNKYNVYKNQFRNAEINRRLSLLRENTRMLLNQK